MGPESPHRMVCHLTMGEKADSSTGDVVHSTLVKWVARRTPLTWLRGVKTVPVELEIEQRDRQSLIWNLKELENLAEIHPQEG